MLLLLLLLFCMHNIVESHWCRYFVLFNNEYYIYLIEILLCKLSLEHEDSPTKYIYIMNKE